MLRSLAAAGCLILLTAAPAAAQTADAGAPAGPLTHVLTGTDLSCQARHAGDSAYEFAPSGSPQADCGTLLAAGGVVYGPNFAAHGGTNAVALGPVSAWTPVAQNAVTGGVSTTVDAAGGLRVVQNDSYSAGQDAWRTDVTVTNSGAATRSVTLYRAGDCALQGTQLGYGFADAANGGGGCAAQPNNSPLDRVMDWVPIGGAASFLHARRDNLWTRVASQTAFAGTCEDCASETDDAAGLSWSFDVVPGGSVTRSHWTVLSPVGRTGAPAAVPPPAPVPPATTTTGGTTIKFTPPAGCVRAGTRYKLRVTSMRKKKISRDRFGYVRRVRILRVDFAVDGETRATDKRAAFKATLRSVGMAPGGHPLAARVLLQPLRTRGKQVLVGKKFRRALPSSVNVCPPAA